MPFSTPIDAETLIRSKTKIEALEQQALSLARSVESVRQGTLEQSNARIEALEEKARDLARFVERTRQQALLQSDKKTEALEQKARDLAEFVETLRNQTRLQSDTEIAALGQQARDLALSVESVRKETRLQSETEIAALGQQARDLALSVETVREETRLQSETEIAALGQQARDLALSVETVREETRLQSETEIAALGQQAQDLALSVETVREETLLHSDTEIAALGQQARDLAVSVAIGREETLLRSETEIKGLKQQARNLAFSVENSRMQTLIESDTVIRKLNAQLEQRVLERTRQLEVANNELEQTSQELVRSNIDLQQFAYVASHDLQEPLRAVAGCVQILEKRYKNQLDARAVDLIGHAVDGVSRMQTLISDLLAYSRVGTRGKGFGRSDCNDSLRIALANLEVSIIEAGAVITQDDLPTILGDDGQLIQVFQNLLGNAIKFRGGDRPEIHVGVQPRNGEWQFSVHDNGIGIQPDYFERIFVIFQRLHTRQDYPGTGIGLAICKKIVERHGGQMWVESESGKGSTFFFTIPTMSRTL